MPCPLCAKSGHWLVYSITSSACSRIGVGNSMPERQVFSARCANHVPLMFIATGEKARISRLATIFAVVAWYFLK